VINQHGEWGDENTIVKRDEIGLNIVIDTQKEGICAARTTIVAYYHNVLPMFLMATTNTPTEPKPRATAAICN
jgi:hypothetical protein